MSKKDILKHQKNLALNRLKQNHAKKMRRLYEDSKQRQRQATNNRDAIALRGERRSYAKTKRRAEQDFNTALRRAVQDWDRKIRRAKAIYLVLKFFNRR